MDYTSFSDLIAHIDGKRGYWFIRTFGGRYYPQFLNGSYVALGYNDMRKSLLDRLPTNENSAIAALKGKYLELHPNDKQAGKAANQLIRFSRHVKKGAVVLIPSADSSEISFGIVTGDLFECAHIADTECPCLKRRNVRWVKTIRKRSLHPNLQLAISSRHALSDMSEYAGYIDSLLNDFYVKEDTATIVLNIRTKEDVTLDEFCGLQSIERIVQGFCEQEHIDYTPGELVMKIQMESPGSMRLSGKQIFAIAFFGLTILSICGGGIEYSSPEGTHFKIGTDGLIEKYNDYMDRKADRELIKSAKHAIDSLHLEKPEDVEAILQILEKRNEIREKY